VIFRQTRYGANGEPIVVLKFRTMYVNEESGEVRQATRGDPRVTRIGRFLRKTSFDELPQLFNVLKGDMSLVGPRPHAVEHNEIYRKVIARYMVRHKVKPGITGLAQVRGWRGETATMDKMAARVECDLEYINNWSLTLDVTIMLRTLKLVLWDRSAF
jgi:putative colanic acid biosynthesis UDP-glucose lipid carrier transferase